MTSVLYLRQQQASSAKEKTTMASVLSYTINDNTVKNGRAERTTFRLTGPTLDNLNFDTVVGWQGTLLTAVQGVTLGNVYKTQLAAVQENPDTPAASLLAQRENKWRVTLVGGGETASFTIGTADLSLLEPNTENMADSAARTSLINAIENVAVASDGVTPMTVQLPIVFVGRNT